MPAAIPTQCSSAGLFVIPYRDATPEYLPCTTIPMPRRGAVAIGVLATCGRSCPAHAHADIHCDHVLPGIRRHRVCADGPLSSAYPITKRQAFNARHSRLPRKTAVALAIELGGAAFSWRSDEKLIGDDNRLTGSTDALPQTIRRLPGLRGPRRHSIVDVADSEPVRAVHIALATKPGFRFDRISRRTAEEPWGNFCR